MLQPQREKAEQGEVEENQPLERAPSIYCYHVESCRKQPLIFCDPIRQRFLYLFFYVLGIFWILQYMTLSRAHTQKSFFSTALSIRVFTLAKIIRLVFFYTCEGIFSLVYYAPNKNNTKGFVNESRNSVLSVPFFCR